MNVSAPTVPPLKRHVVAVVAGNALEFYDFLTYAFFAVYIGRAFFPATDPSASLLLSLATFGAGFITRPIGGIVIGTMGDRIGRKPAMFFTFSLMGVAIVGVALTPSYAAIGVAAPILVLCFRLLQGFALGGEVGPTTAFLIEAAPAMQRGFYGSLQGASQYVANFSAGLVGTVLALTLDSTTLAVWGWRIAFLIGAITIPFGLFVRASLPETLHAADDAALAPDATPRGSIAVPSPMRRHLRVAIVGLAMLAGGTICTYTVLFLSTYAMTVLHVPAQLTFGATMATGLAGMICAPLGGMLSDRIGRKPVMLASNLTLIAVTVPAFLLLLHFPSWPALLAVAGGLAMVQATGGAVGLAALTEALPPRIRAGALSTIYALSIAIFGGTTQFNEAWLIYRTGNALVPALYMSAALVVALIAIVLMPETAPIKTERRI